MLTASNRVASIGINVDVIASTVTPKYTELLVRAPVVRPCILWCGVDKDGVRELAKAIEVLSFEEAAADIARPDPDHTLQGQTIFRCVVLHQPKLESCKMQNIRTSVSAETKREPSGFHFTMQSLFLRWQPLSSREIRSCMCHRDTTPASHGNLPRIVSQDGTS